MYTHFDENFWTSRYLQGRTEWDAGSITIPIKQYLDQISTKDVNILIPGAGNGHEAAYAHKKGLKNVHVLDFSPAPLKVFLKKFPDFPKDYVHQEDFFKHMGQYDLILEQTFFSRSWAKERLCP